MIVILASQLDSDACSLVRAWSAFGAVLLSAEDMCNSGWDFQPSDPARGTAVVEGQRIKIADFRAVLVRRPAVLAEELIRIDSADRAYVAAETNAFLVAWLSALSCPVVNRPTTTSLCGPAWGELHWRVAAARAGGSWVGPNNAIKEREVVVCGQHCLFANTPKQAKDALALARVAGVELMSVWFRGDQICGASVAPVLEKAEVRACLLDHLRGNA